MSQHDLDIANQGFPATRADLNLALKALGSSNSGASAPSTTYANQLWYDTANNILKIRNEDNDAWISLLTLDQSADNIEALTINGTLTVAGNVSVDGGTIKLDGAFPTGTNNTALGDGALDDGSLSGGYNVAIGHAALGENEGGQENVAVGWNSLDANTSGNNNSSLGSQSLSANTSGASNTAVGKNALRSNQTGNDNVAVGSGALDSNTTGNYNQATGRDTLTANTTGSNNAAYGHAALYNNTTASNNTAVGYIALYNNTTGTRNSAVGASAGAAVTTGDDNTFMGFNSGNDVTTASDNTGFGSYTLAATTTGANNTAVGTNALEANTTGTQNIAVGGNAGDAITTGGYNTVIGYNAAGAMTTATYNAFLGRSSGSTVTTGSKNTIIGSYNGNQSNLDIRTTSNNIVISDGDGNPRYEYVSALGTLVLGRGVTYSSIGSNSGALQHYNRDQTQNPRLFPAEDDFTDLGSSSHRYDNIYATDGTIVTSDSRAKENIADSDLGLDFINRLSPKSFTKTGKTRTHYGLVAQDVRSVLSDISKPEEKFAGFIDCNLRSEKDGGTDLLALRYEEFISPLIQAVKDLKAELDAAKTRIATLEAE